MHTNSVAAGNRVPSAWASTRSSGHCSTSGRPVESQRSMSFRQLGHADSFMPQTLSCRNTRARLTCNSAALAQQPLSTYRWPQRRASVLEWLDSCVQDAVRQLDQAPFVQLVYSERAKSLETHCFPRVANEASELWQSVAKHLQTSSPDAVVLVHRLPSFATDHASASQQTGSAENVLTGLSSHQPLDQSALRRDSSTTRSHDILAGKVGDCCDDEHELNQILPFSRQHSVSLPTTGRTFSGAHHDNQEQSLDYWGLIVQSKHNSEAEGCYVLKTVRNSNPVGCQCTHYSLTRLCSNKAARSKSM